MTTDHDIIHNLSPDHRPVPTDTGSLDQFVTDHAGELLTVVRPVRADDTAALGHDDHDKAVSDFLAATGEPADTPVLFAATSTITGHGSDADGPYLVLDGNSTPKADTDADTLFATSVQPRTRFRVDDKTYFVAAARPSVNGVTVEAP